MDRARELAVENAALRAELERARNEKVAWDSRACEAHQPLYGEVCQSCPYCEAVKERVKVTQLAAALRKIEHPLFHFPSHADVSALQEIARVALAALTVGTE